MHDLRLIKFFHMLQRAKTAMSDSVASEEKKQEIPLTRDPEAPPLTPDEEEADAAVHNAATLEQNQTIASNRRHDKR